MMKFTLKIISLSLFSTVAAAESGYIYEKDLNGDGIIDKLESGPSGLFGSGGGPFLLTLSQPDGKFVSRVVGLHPKADSLHSNGSKSQIWGYWHHSADSGTLRAIQLDGSFKAQEMNLHFSPNRSGIATAIYKSIFNPAHLISFNKVENYTPPNYLWGKG